MCNHFIPFFLLNMLNMHNEIKKNYTEHTHIKILLIFFKLLSLNIEWKMRNDPITRQKMKKSERSAFVDNWPQICTQIFHHSLMSQIQYSKSSASGYYYFSQNVNETKCLKYFHVRSSWNIHRTRLYDNYHQLIIIKCCIVNTKKKTTKNEH